MTDNDDKLIEQFFERHPMEIKDDGFSRRVMQRLPEKQLRESRVWTIICSAAGIAMFFLLDMADSLKAIAVAMSGDVAGALSSLSIQGVSPLTAGIALLTITLVTLYNLSADFRNVKI